MTLGVAECGDVRADTLTLNTTPAERARGCNWAEDFDTEEAVQRNNGTLVGSPTVNFGIELDGATQNATYDLVPSTFDLASISILVGFTPDFDWDEDARRYIFVAEDGAGTHILGVYKNHNTPDNYLTIFLGSTTVIENIPSATYSPYWTVGERNVLAISSTSGATDAWLCSVGTCGQILTADPSVWTAQSDVIRFTIGAFYNNTLRFDGTIHSLKVFKALLTGAEVQDFYDNVTYHYINEATLHLPFGAAEHDPTNVRTLDVSGNNAHAIFGDGSTPTTYPTKDTERHGYDYDGGDYLVVPATGLFNSVGITFVLEFWPDFETDVDAVHYLFDGPLITEYAVLKHNNAGNNVLRVYLGNVTIENIAEATYSPFWRKGRRNLLLITGDSVNNLTNVWLNEGQILTDDATAWAPLDPASLYIGARYDASLQFDGKITHFAVYPLLTAMQIADLQIRLQTRVSKQ